MFNPKNRTLNVTTLTFNLFCHFKANSKPSQDAKMKTFGKFSQRQREMHLLVGNSLTRHDFHGKGHDTFVKIAPAMLQQAVSVAVNQKMT